MNDPQTNLLVHAGERGGTMLADLAKLGHKTTVVDDDSEALRLMGTGQYDFVLMRRDQVESHAQRLQEAERLANDLKAVVLPLGVALSGEKRFERLMERILLEAQAVCNADAGTFYLRTPDKKLKFTILRNNSLAIAIGGTTGKEVTWPDLPLYDEDGKPNHRTVATYVGLQGTSVNIPDIYHTEGFDFSGARAFDERNNYRSISSLTVPLKNNDNEVIGVLQLLNAQDRQTKAVIAFDAYAQLVVESLASQAAVALNNQLLLDRQKKFVQFERELQIGRQIQTGFLPASLPELPGWQIAARFRPARDVSGDFYDVFPLSDVHYGLVVADVCNKGVGAALFMTLFRSLIRAFSQQTLSRELAASLTQDSAPGKVSARQLTNLLVQLNCLTTVVLTNNYVSHTHADAFMFVTLFFGVLDITTGALTYVNGGHDAPAVIGPDGVKERLEPTGPVVGMLPTAEYEINKTVLEPGDVLLGYTDGVTEARGPHGEFFTEKRLLAILNEQPVASAGGLLDRIDVSLQSFIAGADPFDDITMLAVRRAPK
jgi:sigma-B regulation protein RsbU (phosphoserine phosphatase)